MSRKLLAVDIDGTVLDDQRRLSAGTKKALATARREGHVVCFVTGRKDIDVASMAEDYLCVDYLVLNNGGKVRSTVAARVLKNELVGEEDARRLISYCLERDIPLHVICGLDWAINRMTPGTRSYARRLGRSPRLFRSLEEVGCVQPESFMATVGAQEVTDFIGRAQLHLTCVQSEPLCIDIVREGVTKWAGLQFVAELVDIPAAQVVAVGNYTNDIELLMRAGTGVAVRNALPDVKAVADYVTARDNNHDAVVEVVDKFILSPQTQGR
jgi:hypothetical protein